MLEVKKEIVRVDPVILVCSYNCRIDIGFYYDGDG